MRAGVMRQVYTNIRLCHVLYQVRHGNYMHIGPEWFSLASAEKVRNSVGIEVSRVTSNPQILAESEVNK